MDDFPQNAHPAPQDVTDSLAILRKKEAPFTTGHLTSRLDLLLLPFLAGIPSLEQRVERLKSALQFAASDLTPEQQLVYRCVYLAPEPGQISHRFDQAAAAINSQRPPEASQASPDAARRIEDTLRKRLGEMLVDPDFAAQLDEQIPIAVGSGRQDRTPHPLDAYELLSYRWEVDIDDDDPRKHEDHRIARIRMVIPHQRVFGQRYFSQRSPAVPVEGGVSMANPEHSYLGTCRDPIDGAPSNWWMSFFHLGRRIEPGEEVTIETRERYFDENRGERSPYLSVVARFATAECLSLGIRVPLAWRGEIQPEARVVRDPLGDRIVDNSWPITPDDDGWARQDFTACEVGLQYGVYLPGLDIYKN